MTDIHVGYQVRWWEPAIAAWSEWRFTEPFLVDLYRKVYTDRELQWREIFAKRQETTHAG